MSVPVVLINLDRSADRLVHMKAQFERADIAFERSQAVDGANLPGSVKPYFCDAAGITVSTLRPGEIGCYASHLSVWQRVAEGKYGPSVLICEDDLTLPDDFGSLLLELISNAPAGWDIIRLSPNTKRAVVRIRSIGAGYNLVRYSSEPGSSAAYLLSQNGARKLLVPSIRIHPVDYDFKKPWVFGLQSFGVWPILAKDGSGPSTIDAIGDRRTAEAQRHKPWRRSAADIVRRPAYGIQTLGLLQWAKCAIWNTVGRKLAAR